MEHSALVLVGYMRVRKANGSQVLDLQRDALIAAGVEPERLYEDYASGKRDRLGRDLRHLVNLVHNLTGRGVGLKVLAGQGANLDTTTTNGRLVFGNLPALAELERELIVERTLAGLTSARARARGRNGGRPFKMTAAKLRLAQAAMGQPGTKVGELYADLGVNPPNTLPPHGPYGSPPARRRKIAWSQHPSVVPDPVFGAGQGMRSTHLKQEAR